jgi:uncharacterized protein YukE
MVEGDHGRNKTWREVHGWSDKAKNERERTTKTRERNREPGRFGKVNWNAYQHDQLYDMIKSADPGAMYERAGQWQSLATRIEDTTGKVQQAMQRVMGAWQGQAAVSSAESNTKLMTWAGDASQTANQVAQGMVTYTEAVERAQKHMPEPAFATAERNFRHGYTVVGTGGPSTAVLLKQLTSDGMVSFEQARARKAEAVHVMETYEAQSKDVHDTMPHFTDATPVTSDVPDRPAGSPGTFDQSRPPGSGRDGGNGSGVGGGSGVGVGVGGAGVGSSTSAAGFTSPGIGGPGGAGGGGLPGGGTSFGSGGLPGGLGSLGSGGSDVIRNSPGFGGLAGVGGVPVAGRGAFGAVAAGGRGAGTGAFGGMPVGHAQGDEDKEHKNKYDLGIDFLDDLPPAYPPVFGA